MTLVFVLPDDPFLLRQGGHPFEFSSSSVAVFILHVPPRKLLEDAPSVERKGLGLRGLVIGKVGGH